MNLNDVFLSGFLEYTGRCFALALAGDRQMYVLGRLRHLQVLDFFLESGNCMVSLDDLARCRNELRVDLSEIEKTFELNTLPADPYLAMGRILGVFGTAAFNVFAGDAV